MERQGDETHLNTDEARGGESTGVMRWVLAVSLLLAIGLLSAIWIFGAWSADDTQSAPAGTQADIVDQSSGTDSVVSTETDQMDAVAAEELPAGTIEN